MLIKGMKQEEVNEILKRKGYKLKLYNKMYQGNNESHSWICNCGEIILSRSFSKIKERNSVLCKICAYNTKEEIYRKDVESDPEYVYERSYRKGDYIESLNRIVGDSPYIQIIHKRCKRRYVITYGGFKQGKRCTCASYEDSIAFKAPHISEMIYADKSGKIIDEEIKATIHTYSEQKYFFKCADCDEKSTKAVRLHQVVRDGYSCAYCADGIHITEKFVSNLLRQLGIHFTLHQGFT